MYTDNCGSVNVTKSGTPTGTDCDWSVTYNYTVEDDCENFATEVNITYSGGDNEAPTLVGTLPTGETGLNLCYADIPSGPSEADIAALYTDNCGSVNVTKSGTPTGTDCDWSVTYNYTIEDDCENFATEVNITYSGGDNEDPVITCPADIYIASCDLGVPTIELPTATDNCDNDVEVTAKRSDGFALNDPYEPGTTTTVTFTAEDECGNNTSCEITVTVEPCVCETAYVNWTVPTASIRHCLADGDG